MLVRLFELEEPRYNAPQPLLIFYAVYSQLGCLNGRGFFYSLYPLGLIW